MREVGERCVRRAPVASAADLESTFTRRGEQPPVADPIGPLHIREIARAAVFDHAIPDVGREPARADAAYPPETSRRTHPSEPGCRFVMRNEAARRSSQRSSGLRGGDPSASTQPRRRSTANAAGFVDASPTPSCSYGTLPRSGSSARRTDGSSTKWAPRDHVPAVRQAASAWSHGRRETAT